MHLTATSEVLLCHLCNVNLAKVTQFEIPLMALVACFGVKGNTC